MFIIGQSGWHCFDAVILWTQLTTAAKGTTKAASSKISATSLKARVTRSHLHGVSLGCNHQLHPLIDMVWSAKYCALDQIFAGFVGRLERVLLGSRL